MKKLFSLTLTSLMLMNSAYSQGPSCNPPPAAPAPVCNTPAPAPACNNPPAYCDSCCSSYLSAAIPIGALVVAGIIIATTDRHHHHGSSSSCCGHSH